MQRDIALQHILRRGVTEIIVEDDFLRAIQERKPLRLKMGFDPSRPDIHLGHVVGLRKLSQLQAMGHQVVLIVGDWTAQIGDPSGQSVTRPMLTHDQVLTNAESYIRQFFTVVDKDRAQVVWQSEWFGKFTLADVIGLTSQFTVSQFLQREDFSGRFRSGKPIAITELLYPLLQAYDSVAVEADVEFGGTDQKFNLLVGRDLQEKMGRRPQQCFIMPMLVGTDGIRKMSKSLDNYIAVDDLPTEMYGKVMSLPDEIMMDYFEWLTDVSDQELVDMKQALATNSVNPMQLKKLLAANIVEQFHGHESADGARVQFESVVQRGEVPGCVRTIELSMDSTVDLPSVIFNAGLATSRSDARRLIDQGAVEINGKKTSSYCSEVGDDKAIRDGSLIKVGRRQYGQILARPKHRGPGMKEMNTKDQ